ncbi:MAG: hypothetical protein DRI89_01330 [Bacteroidetes bacterium]|nr:MAG: hypothetical protein DRI89_01330 [Bacteroidota bacterium]
MKHFLLFFTISILFLSSCINKEKKPFSVSSSELPEIELKIHRYGKALFDLDTSNLQVGLKGIQNEFSLFLAADLNDPENVQQIYDFVSDTQLIFISKKTMEVYPNLDGVEASLSDAFSRYQYFFPKEKIPSVYTYISDLYFEKPVLQTELALVVALDVYLGSSFPLYQQLGLPFYKVRCMEPASFPVDVMKTLYFNDLAPSYKQRTLLDRMIDGGKLMIYLDAVLPNTPDSLKICYTAKKLEWARKNEESVWAFLVGNQLLYSTDYQTQTKLIQDAPFTTGFSNKSPPRLGFFIGWQIVNSYISRHPEVSLEQFLQMTDSQKILQESAYKP